MNKLNNLYFIRITIITFLITLFSFLIDLTNYYEISTAKAIQRIMFDNIYTVIYFLMIWILNYLCYEIFKIIYDSYKEKYFKEVFSKTNILVIISIVVVLVLLLFISIDNLWKVNFILLLLLMLFDFLKELFKKRKIDS